MHPDLQRRVQRYGWDKATPHYEGYWARQLAPAHTRLFEGMALQPGERVLDVACGTGLATFRAAREVGADGAVVGTDLSDAMVSATLEGADRAGLSHVTAERANAETLPFPDASFDVALCALGLMYVPDPAQALREMHRILRPGGRCAVAVWGQRSRCGWAELFPIVDRRVSSDVCPMFFQLGAEGALDHALRTAGFSGDDGERLSAVLDYESEDDACGAAFLGGPVALPYARFDEPTRNEVHREYLDAIALYQVRSGYAIPGEFVVSAVHRP